MTDRFAVIGNPVAHSRSPSIHAQFAAQTGQDLVYDRILAEAGAFDAAVDAFRGAAGAGLNVTVPFKLDAYAYADRLSGRARAAGAVNTLAFVGHGGAAFGDNTDGVGLVADLAGRLGQRLEGSRVLIAGAGGAARGVLHPMLDAGVASIAIVNRNPERAHALAARARDARVTAGGYDWLARARTPRRFDIVVNATSAALSREAPPVPRSVLAGARLAYEMFYGASDTAFMREAREAGAARVADGLGMLVEQAAESFLLWRGVRPDTGPVYARLRAEIASGG